MALKDVLNRFRSISRPSLLGSSSGAYSSLAKKTQAAEDAIIDNQYASGDLSAEFYLNKLQERSVRVTLTPLQRVSLTQKISDVQVAVVDADVSRRYASGELNTDQVLGYEKERLAGMAEPSSAAYIKQQQKVQALEDKAQKETRTQFRVAENLRISRLPEDTSANMWEKANLYQTLSDQARLDGDAQQADTLLAQANNYVNSAKKADINDMISGARLSVSGTPTEGRGVPTAEGGSELLSETGIQTGGGISGGGTGSIKTGFSGFQTPAVKNALESLDRQQNTIERLYGQKQDKEVLIQRYQQAVDQATGDQKTSLTISLNNLKDTLAGIDNQIANTTQSINDTVVRIQEAQAKAAVSEFKKEVRINNSDFDKAENDLESSFRKGEISKFEYIQKGAALAETKSQFLEQASDIFGQYGEDSSAETYFTKANETKEIHQQLVNVENNIDDFEPIAISPGGKITNLFGKAMQPGEVALTNVRNLKDSGVFKRQYVAKDGKFYKVQFPSEIVDSNGDLLPAYVNEDLSKYNDTSFIYTVDKDGKILGKDNPESKVKFAKINNVSRPLSGDSFNMLAKSGAIIEGKDGSWVSPPAPPAVKEKWLDKVGMGVRNVLGMMGISTEGNLFTEAIPNAFKGNTNMSTQPNMSVQPNQSTQLPQQSTQPGLNQKKSGFNFKLPSLVKTAYASEIVPEGVSGGVGDVIDKVAEEMKPGDVEFKKVLHAIALAESGGNPNAVGDQGESIGLFQNRMKKGRGGNYSKEQLLDPEFNTRLAANELVKYYDKAVSKGLQGDRVVAYVSKYGQRPAAGLEENAASKYGGFVNKAIQNVKSVFQSKATPTVTPTPGIPVVNDASYQRKLNNVALALGMKPGTYKNGMNADQVTIDKAFRSDKQTQDLLRSEGFKPSWETKSTSLTSTPIPSAMPLRSGEQAQQSSGSQSNNTFQNVYNNVSNTVRSAVSGIQNYASNIKLPQFSFPKLSTPKPAAPQPVQQSLGQKIIANPVVQKASNFVNTAVSKLKSFFKW